MSSVNLHVGVEKVLAEAAGVTLTHEQLDSHLCFHTMSRCCARGNRGKQVNQQMCSKISIHTFPHDALDSFQCLLYSFKWFLE